MSLPDPIELQRLRFQQGQQLRSQDFRDQIAIEAQLRWWHNRSLHNAYGIAEGFDVERRDRSIIVHPGLAYDSRGRELILQQPKVINLPAAAPAEGAKKIILLARYREASSYPRRDLLSGVCEAGASPLIESPEFLWKPAEQVVPADGVLVAQLLNENGEQTLDEESVLPRSRAMAKPRIVTGATIPGSTAWNLWSVPGVNNLSFPLGVQVQIDTTAAGFTQKPCYFAWLQGALWNPSDPKFIAAPLAHIADPSIDGFTFRLWMPPMRVALSEQTANEFFTARFLSFAQKQSLYVCWLGIRETPDKYSALKDKGATHEHT
ncbi:MAG: hypothetical protein WCB68_17030 [Pyrinomonadaceae bacterium]